MDGDKVLTEGRLFDMFQVKHLLRDAVDDIANKIEDAAKTFAPEDRGKLKLHPVDRDDTRILETPSFFSPGFGTQTNVPAFGGGFSVRGPKGRFIKPKFLSPSVFIPGELVARSTITVAEEPFYAKFVHDGTGIYGPKGTVITAHDPDGFMTFPASRFPTARFKRKEYRFKFVKGQEAQPYLNKAFLLINSTYVPIRIERLRAQIAAET
jgi:hypothetical protein